MPSTERLRDRLRAGDFTGLFIGEMGWDHPRHSDPVRIPDGALAAVAVADKKGVTAFRVDCPGGLPLRAGQDRLVRELRRVSRDQLVVFTAPDECLWLWPEQRPSGVGYRLVAHCHPVDAPTEAILQRLGRASFAISEESSLTSAAVLERVRRSFNAEKVTRSFYREFERHHRSFTEAISGIGHAGDRSWYASLILNRLMFCYFVQNKGFLDGDQSYLRSRLTQAMDRGGPDTFFKSFLLPLFHHGLGDRRHAYGDDGTAAMVGSVPFVNGGIFERHRLETDYDPDIPDSAFLDLFDFFDGWRWHLDERPSEVTNEINPDVLGYIFEQYINQKDYGAYYTKPDVTGYMATSAILPALADRFVSVGLDDPATLLAGSRADYIHDILGHGADKDVPPPPRGSWPWQWHSGDPAEYVELPPPSDDVALPGERWCDVVHRRERYARLLAMLSDGERAWSIDDAVTENLDLPQLLSDYLSQLRDAGECQQAFEGLSSLTVCDPTVGSGAFLFAALDVLEPLYGTLLARSEELESRAQETPDFYAEAREHPSERYWALKTICLRNLYGVDIMAEAPEVAKLRLFLKLAAQIDRVEDLEPLPDLDFNIKCGNLLVGVRDGEDAAKRIAPTRADGQLSLDSVGRIEAISAVAAEMADAYDAFVATQATHDHRGAAAAKHALLERSRSLRADCDDLLHGLREETAPLDRWVVSHQPFHWFIEFPSIWRNGGFDVVIGNPPYIKTKNVTGYRWVGYTTAKFPDLYAVCVERASTLLNSSGRFAMVVMNSLIFGEKYVKLRDLIRTCFHKVWVSNYWAGRMGLFTGKNPRNSIVIAKASCANREGFLATTRYNRWHSDHRDRLFPTLEYCTIDDLLVSHTRYLQWPAVDPAIDLALRWVATTNVVLRDMLVNTSPHRLGLKNTATYQLGIYCEEPPTVDPTTRIPVSTKSKQTVWANFANSTERDLALICLAGRWGYLWWLTYSDEFHVTRSTLAAFPGDIKRLAARTGNRTPDDMELVTLLELSTRLQEEMPNHLTWMTKAGVDVGRYNMAKLRHITDHADWLLAKAWGIEGTFEAAGNLRDRTIFGNQE